MTTRFVVTHGIPGDAVSCGAEHGNDVWVLDWTSAQRNVLRDLTPLRRWQQAPLPSQLEDLLDIASAIYVADIATPRGTHEEWVRTLQLDVPVRSPDFWNRVCNELVHLLYTLTRDNLILRFHPHPDPQPAAPCPPPVSPATAPDCVCLLSGGLDSFAGGALLVHTGRRPLFVSHCSGNPTTETARQSVMASLRRLASTSTPLERLGLRLAPYQSPQALPFPAPDQREPSRRARSFLYMALGVAAAHAVGVTEVFLCENGILTAGLPLTPARSGSLSTRSTHPLAIQLFCQLLAQADVPCSIINPFLYQTKGEVLRRYLKPLVPPGEIMRSVSCWSAGRQSRPCGACVPCLLRRLALLSAGLPDEACMADLLATPAQYRGTDGYGNLVDLLAQASEFLGRTDFDLLIAYPQLLDLDAAGVDVADVLKTLRRHAAEVQSAVRAHFPAAAALMGEMAG